MTVTDALPINHAEAKLKAQMDYEDSNLARCYLDLDAMQSASTAPQSVVEWQPIETAPRDGSYLIAGRFDRDALKWVKHSRWITADEIAELEGGEPDDYAAGWTDGNYDDEPCFPTHWMPLWPPAIGEQSND